MKNMGSVRYEKMSKQAQAVVDATALYYRGALAEAILNGKPPEPPKYDDRMSKRDGKPPNAVAGLYEMMGDMNRRQRRHVLKVLMNEDMGVHRMTAGSRAKLEKWVQPGSKQEYWERVNLTEEYAAIYKPPGKDEGELIKWSHGVLQGFLPGVSPTNDGRPDDEEPGPPEPGDEVTPTPRPPSPPVTPVTQFLHFNVDGIECEDDTNGEKGTDEISYSGVALHGPMSPFYSPVAADGTLLDIRDAGSFWPGSARDLTAEPPLHSYNLSGLNLPRLFLVHVCMAEMDNPKVMAERFQQFMNSFYYDILYESPNHWGAYLAEIALGAAAGGLVGAVGGSVIGAVIGAIVGGILGGLLVFSTFGNADDVFTPEAVWIELSPNPVNASPFNGALRTPTMSVEMRGDGGRYQLLHHWSLSGFASFGPGDQDGDAA